MNIVIFGTVWPEPASSAAGTRMMQLIHFFQEKDWNVRFVSAAHHSPFMENLESFGVKTAAIELNSSSLDQQLDVWKPDMVLYDRFMTEEQFGWRVHDICPDALTILDTEDLHFLRKARQKAVNAGKTAGQADLISDVALREIASIHRCDCSLIISRTEMELLKNTFSIPDSHLYYLPFLIGEEEIADVHLLPKREERVDFMTIGNMIHPPNADAVLWLYREIWPEIRKHLPDVNMHVYGAYPVQSIKQLHKPALGFYVHGRAESAQEVIQQSRVMLAPLRFGAGLKGKLMDAMLGGTPSVTTSIGAEGFLKETENWPGFISDSPAEFADKAVELYKNATTWKNAQRTGVNLLKSGFLKTDFSEDFIQRLDWMRQNLKEHRAGNFTGMMLRHHSMRSTKFMAKWIEEKNRKKTQA